MNLSVELQDLTPEIFARLTTPEIKRAVLVAALRETPYVPTVAEKTGTDVVTLWRLAKDESIRLRKTPAARPVELVYASPLSSLAEKPINSRYISQEIHSAIIKTLKENPNVQAVAKQFQGEASSSTIYRIVNKNKILLKRLKRGRRNKLSDTKILKIYNECKNITATAQVAEICRGTVAQILKRSHQPAPGSTAAKRFKRRKANFSAAPAAVSVATGTFLSLDQYSSQPESIKEAERLKRMWAKFIALRKT